MKADVTVLDAASAPPCVPDPAPPAVNQEELLLGSGLERCESTGRIIRFSICQRAKEELA